MADYILFASTVCSECSEQRAQQIVEILQENGWDIRYGGLSGEAQLPSDSNFTQDFYDAVDDTY
jgi:hypothetical protein